MRFFLIGYPIQQHQTNQQALFNERVTL